eukprot:scaffold693_cov399-Prasinococcus_capsulatus_cf.AAC.26
MSHMIITCGEGGPEWDGSCCSLERGAAAQASVTPMEGAYAKRLEAPTSPELDSRSPGTTCPPPKKRPALVPLSPPHPGKRSAWVSPPEPEPVRHRSYLKVPPSSARNVLEPAVGSSPTVRRPP